MPADGLHVEALHCSYGSNSVLLGVDLHVEFGQVVGLIGRNGAGKTTTLKAISGVVPRRSGTISFAGKELNRGPSATARAGVSHVPEGRGLIGALTAEENLRVAAYGAGKTLDADRLARAVHAFPRMERVLDRRADVLSGGEQQMVALARALVAEARVIMVDELSLGLAPVVVEEAWQALLALRESRGLGLLVVDQNLGLIEKYCDTVYLLKHGRTHAWEDHGSTEVTLVY